MNDLHFVQLHSPSSYVDSLRSAAEEHRAHMVAAGKAGIGYVGVRAVAQPGVKITPGARVIIGSVEKPAVSHPLARAFLLGAVGVMNAADLGEHFSPQVVPQGSQGIVLAYADPEHMRLVHLRAHELMNQQRALLQQPMNEPDASEEIDALTAESGESGEMGADQAIAREPLPIRQGRQRPALPRTA